MLGDAGVKRRDLAAIKQQTKRLRSVEFKPLRKRQLPKPLNQLGGPRMSASGLLPVADDLCVAFLIRSGETLARRAFFGYLFQQTQSGLLPLMILHYHPSHKGVHVLVNCETARDYTERQLPGAPELALRTPAEAVDPDTPQGRNQLITLFCARCGIAIAPDDEQLL